MQAGLVIIGTGLAGYMLAREWRKLDADTPLTIITADDGVFYSKPMLSNALTKAQAPAKLIMKSMQTMADELDASIKVHCKVKAINTKQNSLSTSDGDIYYKKLVLAVGADKLNLPVTGSGVENIRSINNLTDYREFHAWLAAKNHIAVLGAGLVGCEFANDLLTAKHQVSIISPDPYPLPKLVPEKIGRVVETAFAKAGINWYLSQAATAVHSEKNHTSVQLDNDKMVKVDGVLAAIGLRAHIALAKAAGIKVDRGIVVDRYLQTNIKNIYALGDCAEVSGQVQQYVAPLLQAARALAKILNGHSEQVHYPCMPVVIKTPLCPVVAVPPPISSEGQWQYQGEGLNWRAEFYDQTQQLQGFALSGSCVAARMELVKKIPPVFAAN
ncbi:MAG: FAD-dependent oxidoreductase [Gammaproteobacteria bacterium]|nr:FAD-dependent oxidoreductase [Gammaproteobacteria bacterium]